MKYTYYRQNDDTKSIRRYPDNSQTGERWDRNEKCWTKQCATRDCCLQTNDTIITEDEVKRLQ